MKLKYGFGEIVRIIRVKKAMLAAEMTKPCDVTNTLVEYALGKHITDTHVYFFVSNKLIKQLELTYGTRIIVNFGSDKTSTYSEEFGWEVRTAKDLLPFGLSVNYKTRTITLED